MLAMITKRVGQSIFILLGVTMITFSLSFLMPADPVRMIAGRSATPEAVESIRKELGLDKPLLVQYVKYLSRLVQLDLEDRTNKKPRSLN